MILRPGISAQRARPKKGPVGITFLTIRPTFVNIDDFSLAEQQALGGRTDQKLNGATGLPTPSVHSTNRPAPQIPRSGRLEIDHRVPIQSEGNRWETAFCGQSGPLKCKQLPFPLHNAGTIERLRPTSTGRYHVVVETSCGCHRSFDAVSS